MLCVYVHRPVFIYLFMLRSFMVLQILQLRTLYKTMFIPEMTFYRKPDKGWLVNQKQPSSSYVLCSLNVNYILVKHNIKNLI